MVELTAALAAAYVSRNAVASEDLPTAIRCIHAALLAVQNGGASGPTFVLPTRSEIAASIRYDQLVSFIDGKPYKTLKRHLTAHGMTPSEYRRRYGLPDDYPMVSPGYAAVRARIANQLYHGLEAA
ncbi:MucR family transcriptional regulator [Methylobacterium sp. 1973]|uniref:MucR family transcriptional regulator n=1 Tax=Methylobacterium sp. 1973 TaxID=3156421 RepID=UPI003398E599